MRERARAREYYSFPTECARSDPEAKGFSGNKKDLYTFRGAEILGPLRTEGKWGRTGRHRARTVASDG